MGLFGPKKPEGHTVLVLDMESGSVAATLVHVQKELCPRLFGEIRVNLPVSHSVRGSNLVTQIEKVLHDVIRHISEVAARVRTHEETQELGRVERSIVFLAPPWGRPNLYSGKPEFMDQMSAVVRASTESRLGRMPISFYTTAGLATFGNSILFEPEPALLLVVGGEVSELLHFDGSQVRAHATVPVGTHSLIRTLRTHGGLSELEARSAARLPFETPHLREPFHAAAFHIGSYVASATKDVLQGNVRKVRIVGEDVAAHWFAQALAVYEPLGAFFPQGGEIRALRAAHLTPHLAAHQEVPDARLMLGALFVDSRLQ